MAAGTDFFKWKAFAAEIDELGREIRHNTGKEDLQQFIKMERWGRWVTLLGYATSWIAPNPISALLISQGNFARWSLVLHQISHGVMERIPNVPSKYTKGKFAQGYRRFVDWFDWITPGNWHDEHNKLHHYHLGTPKDPDVVWRNSAYIQSVRSPLVRYALVVLMACVWKPFYYAVNTVAESRFQRGLLESNKIGWNNWTPMTPEGRELWFVCLLPYALFRFALIPALFLPLGKMAALCVLLNSVLAEIFTNLHSFAVIAPNHTGDDVFSFAEASNGRAEYFLRQIVGSVNYPAGSDAVDFLYGGMNYQIEHHLWPEASLLQCQRVRPKLKALCRRYGVHYNEAPLLPRVFKTVQIMAGASVQIEVPRHQRLT